MQIKFNNNMKSVKIIYLTQCILIWPNYINFGECEIVLSSSV